MKEEPKVSIRQCPLCGEDNACTMASPDLKQSTCWCTEEKFPKSLLESLPEESKGVVCICRRCVVKARRKEAQARPLPAPRTGEDFYSENGLLVFTEIYHRRRGYCCGGGCRHCPFDVLERELAFAAKEPER